jgi:hypothetical protein
MFTKKSGSQYPDFTIGCITNLYYYSLNSAGEILKTRRTIALVIIIIVLLIILIWTLNAKKVAVEQTLYLGNVTLDGDYQFGHFDQVWDLTACNIQISFTYDANGLVDDDEAQAWSLLGVRQAGFFDFNPLEGTGVWLTADFEWFANTFDPDPVGSPILDIDDRLILQNTLGNGEGFYDLPSIPPNDWANHAVWFDRDGVGQSQAQTWGIIDGVTYNTGGSYDVVMDLEAASSSKGEAYLTINGESQGFYVPAWHPGPADLMPAGITFTGDMTQMQVFYFLNAYGSNQIVKFNDITVTGCLTLEEGTAIGGG